MSFQTIRRTPYGCIMLQRAKNGAHALIVNPAGRYRDLYRCTVHTVPSDMWIDADIMAQDLHYACTGQHDKVMTYAMRKVIRPVPSAEYR